MADGKWIPDLMPDTPVADAARRALSVRLEVVRDNLPPALEQADKDPEYVHQLRVGTRRAAAALEIFAPCLPDKAYRAARRQLRRIRRAAGAARDGDVFLLGLGSPEAQRERWQPAWDFLIGHTIAERAAAQEQLRAASPNHPFDFERLLAETIAAIHKPHMDSPIRTLLDLALPLLNGLLKQLHEAAAGDLNDYEHLHRVRIIGKRLRYAMEIFANCFAPAFKDTLYVAVEEMQEILGRANDSHVAVGRLQTLRDRLRLVRPADYRRHRQGIDGLIRRHRERVPQERDRFLEWWKKWQESGSEADFAALVQVQPSVAS
jgi:CHAD domain-containing protein